MQQPQLFRGNSTIGPPLLNGSIYNYWKPRMIVYPQSVYFDLWEVINLP